NEPGAADLSGHRHRGHGEADGGDRRRLAAAGLRAAADADAAAVARRGLPQRGRWQGLRRFRDPGARRADHLRRRQGCARAEGADMARLTINGKTCEVNVDPSTPLLWAIREQVGLTGTKYGCGMALCGACTVHVDGKATRSCVMPVSAAVGKKITTIEGLATN